MRQSFSYMFLVGSLRTSNGTLRTSFVVLSVHLEDEPPVNHPVFFSPNDVLSRCPSLYSFSIRLRLVFDRFSIVCQATLASEAAGELRAES